MIQLPETKKPEKQHCTLLALFNRAKEGTIELIRTNTTTVKGFCITTEKERFHMKAKIDSLGTETVLSCNNDLDPKETFIIKANDITTPDIIKSLENNNPPITTLFCVKSIEDDTLHLVARLSSRKN